MAPAGGYERGDKFIRVIGLFERLALTRTGVTSTEIAAEMGVDVRSVQRYLTQMRAAGIDIETDDDNRHRLGPGTRLPPLQLTRPEAVAVLVALRLLQQMRPLPDDALVGAVARLAQAIHNPAVTAYLGDMLEEAERAAGTAAAAEQEAAAAVERVVTTCFADRVPVEISYTSSSGEVTTRTIRPYFLEPRPESRTLYVFAHDSRSRSLRLFRMDRISAARAVPIEGLYTVPEDFDIAAVTRSSWGVWQPGEELEEVVLRFGPGIAERVRQTIWHSSQVMTTLGGGGVELRLRVASEVEMRPWVLGWGSLVEVLAPASLREHVAASMREGARLYGDT